MPLIVAIKYQNWNYYRKLDVLTIEIPWVLLLNRWRYLMISSAILRTSSSSSFSSSATTKFYLSFRHTSGLMSMIKLLEIRPLIGELKSFYKFIEDLKAKDVVLGTRAIYFWAVGLSHIVIFSIDLSGSGAFLGVSFSSSFIFLLTSKSIYLNK